MKINEDFKKASAAFFAALAKLDNSEVKTVENSETIEAEAEVAEEVQNSETEVVEEVQNTETEVEAVEAETEEEVVAETEEAVDYTAKITELEAEIADLKANLNSAVSMNTELTNKLAEIIKSPEPIKVENSAVQEKVDLNKYFKDALGL